VLDVANYRATKKEDSATTLAHAIAALAKRNTTQACINDVFDTGGKRYTPREWFIAPSDIIEQAIRLIISGDVVNLSV